MTDETLHIDHSLEFLAETLSEISQAQMPTHSAPCPHCGIPVRYPLIARSQDVEDFRLIMDSASRVMKRYNITANLLAEIKAEAHLAIAKKRTEPKP